MKEMLTNNDLKSYIKGYLANRQITYTRLDKHDRAIGVLINENEKQYKIIKETKKYIEEHNKLFRDNRSIGEYAVFLKFANNLLAILNKIDEEGELEELWKK